MGTGSSPCTGLSQHSREPGDAFYGMGKGVCVPGKEGVVTGVLGASWVSLCVSKH